MSIKLSCRETCAQTKKYNGNKVVIIINKERDCIIMSYPNHEKYSINSDLSNDTIAKMLKNTTAKDFLLSNPSGAFNRNFGGIITNPFFFKYFHYISLLSYSGLIRVYEISQHNHQNTIFITGYRGSGKTTFSYYLEEIINDGWFIDAVNQDDFLRYYAYEGKQREGASTYSKMYSERFDELLDGLLMSVGDNRIKKREDYINIQELTKQELYHHVNVNIERLSGKLKGNCFRFNLETDIDKQKERPISQKLRHIIIKILSKYFRNIENAPDNKMLQLIKNVYYDLNEHFVEGVFSRFSKFFKFILDDIANHGGIANMSASAINEHLEPYTVYELLGAMMLMDIFQIKLKNERKQKLFYIFDNLDIIENPSILHTFISAYNEFATGFGAVVDKLKNYYPESNDLHFNFNYSEDYCCIFFMRDTTARRLNDHDNGRLYEYSINFDSSEYVDKGKIVLQRCKYVAEHQEIEQINPKLYQQLDMLSSILNDDYVRLNIAGLFNNDYVRFVTCLTEIFESNHAELDEYLKIKNNIARNKQSYDKLLRYGARGILFRLIFNHLKDKKYLSKIGINESMLMNGYTQVRLVLFYLFYKQPRHYSSFMDSKNTLVTFSDMKRDFCRILNDKNESDVSIAKEEAVKILANALWSMYDLKQSPTWVHLVTFDAIDPKRNNNELDDDLTYDDILNALSEGSAGHVSITCAGRSYVVFMCSHFEFFSMRFGISNAEKSKSDNDDLREPYNYALFSKATYNQNYYQTHGKYLFEVLIEHFYNDFNACLTRLSKQENSMFNRAGYYSKTDIFTSAFVFHHPRSNNSSRHLERAMQRIITYIDAYRLFLVNSIAQKNITQVVNFNTKMIRHLEAFVDLMADSSKDFSRFSNRLVVNYRNKIKVVKDSGYNDTLTQLGKEDAP